MLPSRRWTDGDAGDDSGSAPIEFIVAGLLLLVPLVYLMLALGAIQHQALGAETGARHTARAVATAADAAEAGARAAAVLAAVASEYGMDAEHTRIEFRCIDQRSDCPSAGATLVITLATRVQLPLVPSVLGLDRIASVPVEAQSVHKVSRFWGSP